MLKRVWRVVHPLLTLVAVGCCVYLLLRSTAGPRDAREPHEPRDAELRALLKVRTLESHYALPPGEDHCGILLMQFENGRNIGPFTGTTFSVGEDGSRRVPFQFLCGKTRHGVRALVSSPKWGFTSGGDFFDDLDGGPAGWSFGTTTIGELDGSRVIAFASSRECRPGFEAFQNSSGKNTADLIEKRKRVLVLVVKPFTTEADAERWVEGELSRRYPRE